MDARRRILVVGATSDVGAACARVLSMEGHELLLHGRSPDALSMVGATLAGKCEQFIADVTDEASVNHLMNVAISNGRVDGLVYAAGLHKLSPIRTLSPAKFVDVFQANVGGFMQCARAFSRMSGGGDRAIVAIASIAAHRAEAGAVAYASAKAALLAAARGAALEFASLGIRVNTISPGWMEGRTADAVASRLGPEVVDGILTRYPLGFGRPEDVAEAAAFLLSPRARWITGTDLVLDGGRSLT